MPIRAFFDTMIWLAGLSTQSGGRAVTLRNLMLDGHVRPVTCERQVREALIVLGKTARFDPIRHAYAYVYLVHHLGVSNKMSLAADPDRLAVLATRSRVDDPDDAWWIALAERDGLVLVSEDHHLREARTSATVMTLAEFLKSVQLAPGDD